MWFDFNPDVYDQFESYCNHDSVYDIIIKLLSI
jgi:hypothetical protein